MPEVTALMKSVDTLLDTSNFAFAIVPRGESHVNGSVDWAVQVGRLDVHLVKFPVLGCGESNDCSDG